MVSSSRPSPSQSSRGDEPAFSKGKTRDSTCWGGCWAREEDVERTTAQRMKANRRMTLSLAKGAEPGSAKPGMGVNQIISRKSGDGASAVDEPAVEFSRTGGGRCWCLKVDPNPHSERHRVRHLAKVPHDSWRMMVEVRFFG